MDKSQRRIYEALNNALIELQHAQGSLGVAAIYSGDDAIRALEGRVRAIAEEIVAYNGKLENEIEGE